ncbi:MAG: hypothetical protein NC416_16780 [Eubacterium sp.]|nr:hypothetical protein [Eubacterium sp.]
MSKQNEWDKFIDRTNNFHWLSEQLKQAMIENKFYYEYFYNLANHFLQKEGIPKNKIE